MKIYTLILAYLVTLAIPTYSFSLELKNVLLLQSYHSGYKWTDDIDTAIKQKLTRKAGVDLRIEYLDTKRYVSTDYLQLVKNSLTKKYKKTTFDVIICVDNNAFKFLLNNRSELFTNVPIVFCGINFFKQEMLKGQTEVTGISEETDTRKTVQLMLQVHPDTKRIIAVNDNTTTGKILTAEVKEISKDFDTVEWLFTEGFTFKELEELASNLQLGDLVLHSLFLRDIAGDFLEYDLAVNKITENTLVPVYSLWDFNLGHGVVGGLMISGKYQGDAAADMVLKILQGVPITELPVTMKSPNHYFADYSVLKKLNIDPTRFPEQTIFINKPEDLYTKYKVQVWFTGLLVTVLFMTSLILFIAVTKRKNAEAKLLKLTNELDERVRKRTNELSIANTTLQNREEDMKRLVGNLSGVVYRCQYDDSWTMDFMSEAVTELTGYTVDDIVFNHRISYNELIDPLDRNTVRETVVAAINDRVKFTIEYRIRTKTGATKWVWEQGTAIFDDQDNVLYIDGFITDISQRKAYEKDQVKLAEAVHQTDDLVIITDLSGTIEYTNPTFERTTGYSRAEVIGKNPRILKSGKMEPAFYKQMWETLLSGNVFRGRVINSRKDGSEYTAQVTISPIKDKSGDTTNYVGVQKDISHEIVMEQNLRQAQKLEAMGTLAGGIAHEINTPAQFVGSNLEFILESLPDLTEFVEACHKLTESENNIDDPLKKELTNLYEDNDIDYLLSEIPAALEQSKDGIDQVSKIVRSMKQFAHPGHETAKATDLNEALENTATVCRNEWKFSAQIVYDLEPNLPMVPCHQSELNQVFLNLIVNAAHAIGTVTNSDKGTITLTTKNADDFVEIRIADDGPGIPEDIQPKIFDPFFTTKEPGKGTGQGLAIAYSIVKDKHNGEITFESEPGKGTAFIIRLPVNMDRQDNTE